MMSGISAFDNIPYTVVKANPVKLQQLCVGKKYEETKQTVWYLGCFDLCLDVVRNFVQWRAFRQRLDDCGIGVSLS
jgi:hypothetical protein